MPKESPLLCKSVNSRRHRSIKLTCCALGKMWAEKYDEIWTIQLTNIDWISISINKYSISLAVLSFPIPFCVHFHSSGFICSGFHIQYSYCMRKQCVQKGKLCMFGCKQAELYLIISTTQAKIWIEKSCVRLHPTNLKGIVRLNEKKWAFLVLLLKYIYNFFSASSIKPIIITTRNLWNVMQKWRTWNIGWITIDLLVQHFLYSNANIIDFCSCASCIQSAGIIMERKLTKNRKMCHLLWRFIWLYSLKKEKPICAIKRRHQ